MQRSLRSDEGSHEWWVWVIYWCCTTNNCPELSCSSAISVCWSLKATGRVSQETGYHNAGIRSLGCHAIAGGRMPRCDQCSAILLCDSDESGHPQVGSPRYEIYRTCEGQAAEFSHGYSIGHLPVAVAEVRCVSREITEAASISSIFCNHFVYVKGRRTTTNEHSTGINSHISERVSLPY